MGRFNISYVTCPKDEFRSFAKGRIEGLALTENHETVELYRQAMEEGLAFLEEPEALKPIEPLFRDEDHLMPSPGVKQATVSYQNVEMDMDLDVAGEPESVALQEFDERDELGQDHVMSDDSNDVVSREVECENIESENTGDIESENTGDIESENTEDIEAEDLESVECKVEEIEAERVELDASDRADVDLVISESEGVVTEESKPNNIEVENVESHELEKVQASNEELQGEQFSTMEPPEKESEINESERGEPTENEPAENESTENEMTENKPAENEPVVDDMTVDESSVEDSGGTSTLGKKAESIRRNFLKVFFGEKDSSEADSCN
jgi:hypothetical protein